MCVHTQTADFGSENRDVERELSNAREQGTRCRAKTFFIFLEFRLPVLEERDRIPKMRFCSIWNIFFDPWARVGFPFQESYNKWCLMFLHQLRNHAYAMPKLSRLVIQRD